MERKEAKKIKEKCKKKKEQEEEIGRTKSQNKANSIRGNNERKIED